MDFYPCKRTFTLARDIFRMQNLFEPLQEYYRNNVDSLNRLSNLDRNPLGRGTQDSFLAVLHEVPIGSGSIPRVNIHICMYIATIHTGLFLSSPSFTSRSSCSHFPSAPSLCRGISPSSNPRGYEWVTRPGAGDPLALKKVFDKSRWSGNS
jgi:hypothetical protein